MLTAHFFKRVFAFTLMIAFGLVSMVLIANWDKTPTEAEVPAPLADSETATPDSPCEGNNC
jgi:hypothetical protein